MEWADRGCCDSVRQAVMGWAARGPPIMEQTHTPFVHSKEPHLCLLPAHQATVSASHRNDECVQWNQRFVPCGEPGQFSLDNETRESWNESLGFRMRGQSPPGRA